MHASSQRTSTRPLARAQAVGTRRPVTWQLADAMQLSFDDGSFDLVLCQFGVMFFPDKPKAFAEAHRVLSHGGTLLFNVWDRIEENDFARTVSDALARLFPDSPPDFMARTPYGYHRQDEIAQHLRQGGFQSAPAFESVAAPATPRRRASWPSRSARARRCAPNWKPGVRTHCIAPQTLANRP
jgi:ubiquinone/menaquinone biosynthesis C-methylase UbiE